MFATRHLHKTWWKASYDNICAIKIFQKLDEFKSGSLSDQILLQIKQVALRVYLIESNDTRSNSSLSVQGLMNQFGLEKKQIMKLVSQLIAKKKLNAKIDLTTGNVVFDKELAPQGAV